MNSLKSKILSLTIAILAVTVGLSTWHNLRTQDAMLARVITQDSRVLGETVRNIVITYMTSGQSAEIGTALERIRKEPAIETVRVFDDTGRILASAEPEEVGDRVADSELYAFRTGDYFHSTTRGDREFHSRLVPIYNAESCHGCHEPDREVLGVLNLQLSKVAVDTLQAKGREATLLSSSAMLVVLTLSISLFILFYVDAPIRRLVRAMDHVEQGEFDRAPSLISRSEEMALLTGKFNLMVERLKDLIETKVRQEREIAITQAKLTHHDEVRTMNAALEERVGEIEVLNLTLEERIREIEEANLKIADLAGDLENKNTTLERAVGRLSALYRMGLAVNSTMDTDELFTMLIRKTVDTLEAKAGYIFLLEENGREMRVARAEGLPERPDPNLCIPIKAGGLSHWTIENRRPLRIEDMEKEAAFNRVSPLGLTRETAICAPLIIQEEVIGTVTMANKRDGSAFTAEDLELLATIAAQASVAFNNARLYEDQQKTYLSTVQALVSAVEASDAYTCGHSERVTRYCLVLAREMGVAGESLNRLEQAAILHDIGKIGIAVELLHKVDKLSSGDIDLLREHPIIGTRILEPIHFLKGVSEIIEQHHERFDGTGYPYGIRGEDLLIEARILAVADTYDAMTSDRPYREGLSPRMAIEEIGAQAGTQFDPEVAAAFARVCRRGALLQG